MFILIMEEETSSDNDTIKQYRLSEDKRVRIVYDPVPPDPEKHFDDPDDVAYATKFWKEGEVYGIIYEKRDHCNNENHDCWVQTDSAYGNYGLDDTIQSIDQ